MNGNSTTFTGDPGTTIPIKITEITIDKLILKFEDTLQKTKGQKLYKVGFAVIEEDENLIQSIIDKIPKKYNAVLVSSNITNMPKYSILIDGDLPDINHHHISPFELIKRKKELEFQIVTS